MKNLCNKKGKNRKDKNYIFEKIIFIIVITCFIYVGGVEQIKHTQGDIYSYILPGLVIILGSISIIGILFNKNFNVGIKNNLIEEINFGKNEDGYSFTDLYKSRLGILIITFYSVFFIYFLGYYSADTFITFTFPLIITYSVIFFLLYNLVIYIHNKIINEEKIKNISPFLILYILMVIFIFLLILYITYNPLPGLYLDFELYISLFSVVLIGLFILKKFNFKPIIIIYLIFLFPFFIFTFVPANYFGGLKPVDGYLINSDKKEFYSLIKNIQLSNNFGAEGKNKNLQDRIVNSISNNIFYNPKGSIYLSKVNLIFEDEKNMFIYDAQSYTKKKIDGKYIFWPGETNTGDLVPYYIYQPNYLNLKLIDDYGFIKLKDLSFVLSKNDSTTYKNKINNLYLLNFYNQINGVSKMALNEKLLTDIQNYLTGSNDSFLNQFNYKDTSLIEGYKQQFDTANVNLDDNKIDENYKEFLKLIFEEVVNGYSNAIKAGYKDKNNINISNIIFNLNEYLSDINNKNNDEVLNKIVNIKGKNKFKIEYGKLISKINNLNDTEIELNFINSFDK